MSKRIFITIGDNLYQRLKKENIPHDSDSELIKNSIILFLGERENANYLREKIAKAVSKKWKKILIDDNIKHVSKN